MTGFKELQINVADLIKAAVVGLPALLTIGSAIWYFSAWSEKVNNRLDDIDKDLKRIHEHYEHEDQASPFERPSATPLTITPGAPNFLSTGENHGKIDSGRKEEIAGQGFRPRQGARAHPGS